MLSIRWISRRWISRRSFTYCSVATAALLLPALFLILSGCESTSAPSSEDPSDPTDGLSAEECGVSLAMTDSTGQASATDGSGEEILVVETLDASGTPLPSLMIAYLTSEAGSLIAFNDAENGDPVGMFIVEGTNAAKGAAADSASGPVSATFILSLLDPTLGRLYDPHSDDFTAGVQNNIGSIRAVLDWEELETILLLTPGVDDLGCETIGELAQIVPDSSEMEYIIERYPRFSDFILQRFGTLVQLAENQHSNYRYRKFRNPDRRFSFYVPLGLEVDVQIVEPAHGSVYVSPGDREQQIWGALDVTPDVVMTDGGSLQLSIDGVPVGTVFQIVEDGVGGASFTSQSLLELGEGETTIEVTAFVNSANRGFETPVDGRAGSDVSVVTYQGETTGPFTPVLSDLSHPTYFPCPALSFYISFTASDADGDITTLFLQTTSYWDETGETTVWDPVPVPASSVPGLEGTGGECELPASYDGTDGGDWIRTEMWVVDSGGRESNHLTFQANIVGDCDPFDKRGEEPFFSLLPDCGGR